MVARRQTEAQPQPPEDATPLVTVTVAGNFQVSYAGSIYGPGETATVPEELADRWAMAGLVTR